MNRYEDNPINRYFIRISLPFVFCFAQAAERAERAAECEDGEVVVAWGTPRGMGSVGRWTVSPIWNGGILWVVPPLRMQAWWDTKNRIVLVVTVTGGDNPRYHIEFPRVGSQEKNLFDNKD